MTKSSGKAAARVLLRRINADRGLANRPPGPRRLSSERANRCWNLASAALGYADEGKLAKAKAKLIAARACLRK